MIDTNENYSSDETIYSDEIIEEQRKLSQEKDDMEFLEWYGQQAALIQSEVDLLNAQHNRRIRALDSRMRQLDYFHAERAMQIADGMIQSQKKVKYIDTTYGRFQARDTKPTIKVTSPEEFIQSCQSILSEAEMSIVIDRTPKLKTNEVKKIIKYMGGGQYVHASTGVVIGAGTIRRMGIVGEEQKRTVSFSPPNKTSVNSDDKG